MQFQNKIKIVLSVMLVGTIAVGIVLAQATRTQVNPLSAQLSVAQRIAEQPNRRANILRPNKAIVGVRDLQVSRSPVDKTWAKAFEDQERRSLTIEKQARQFLKERHFDEAEKACYSALALSPKWKGQPMASSTFQLLGDVFREQGRYQDALDSYFKARQHTRDLELDLGIALSYLKMGDIEKARQFYSEEKLFGSQVELPPAQKAIYMASLPGTQTVKTMEASILYARGCEKGSYAARDEAVVDFKKALALVPRNALIAYTCALDLGNIYRSQEAALYWARAAVFGKGYIAERGRVELRNILMPAQAEQALLDARKIG